MKDSLASLFEVPLSWRWLCLVLALAAVSGCQSAKTVPPEVIVLIDDSGAGSIADTRVSFKNEIAPLLQARCVSCHYDEGPLTGLSFQRRATLLDDSDGRSILVPGDPEKSTLFLVTVMPDYFVEAMPPTGHRLTDTEASNIYRWIAQGADWPKDIVLKPGVAP